MCNCYRDHKRHDNFTDIGICPKTGAKPRKLQLSDMEDNEEQGEPINTLSMYIYKVVHKNCTTFNFAATYGSVIHF